MLILYAPSSLMKYAQSNVLFICDFFVAVKILQMDLIEMYAMGEKIEYTQAIIWYFNAIVFQTHDSISMKWTFNELDLNASKVEYITFEPNKYNIRATFCDGDQNTNSSYKGNMDLHH